MSDAVERGAVPGPVRWGEIALFFAVAVGLSAPFRLGLVDVPRLLQLPPTLAPLASVLRAIGPLAAFVLLRHVLRSSVPRTTTFLGPRPAAAIAAWWVIPVGIVAARVVDPAGGNGALGAVVPALALAVYCLFEEFGWRGYLQQAFGGLSLRRRVLAVGVLWYLWHLNFLLPGQSLTGHLIHLAGLLAGAWGLMKVADVTGSIAFCAGVHMAFNLLFDVGLPLASKLLILGVAAVLWAVLLLRIAGRRTQGDRLDRYSDPVSR